MTPDVGPILERIMKVKEDVERIADDCRRASIKLLAIHYVLSLIIFTMAMWLVARLPSGAEGYIVVVVCILTLTLYLYVSPRARASSYMQAQHAVDGWLVKVDILTDDDERITIEKLISIQEELVSLTQSVDVDLPTH